MANRKRRRRKIQPGRLLLVLAVPVALTGALVYGVVQLVKPRSSLNALSEQNVQVQSSDSDVQSSSDSSQSQDLARQKQTQTDQKKQEDQQKQLDEIQTIQKTAAGSQVDVSDLDESSLSQLFYAEEIPADVLASMEGVTYSSSQDFISPDDLRLIRVLYTDYNGQDCVGELIVNEQIAQDTIEVFQELYEAEYPIAQIVLPDLYSGDDNLSMAANNTSAFSFRLSDGVGIAVHEHSLGLGIDLNPLQNPQVIEEDGTTMVFPYSGLQWSDRSIVQDHMINHEDIAYQIFTEHGFSWGGDWSQRQDYMHFEKDYDASWYRIIG